MLLPQGHLFSWTPSLGIRSGLSSERLRILEKLILEGRPFLSDKLSPLPLWISEQTLGTDGLALCRETSFSLSNSHLDVLASTTDLLIPHELPESKVDQLIWAERMFLRGFALYRIDRGDEAQQTWERVAVVQLELEADEALRAKIAIEEAAELMNRGCFHAAYHRVHSIEGLPPRYLDVMTFLRASVVLSISYAGSGDPDKANEILTREMRVLDAIQCPRQALCNLRRRILVYIDQEKFDQAQDLLKIAVFKSQEIPVTLALLLELKVEMHLIRNELQQAHAELDRILGLIKSTQLSPAVLYVPEIHCELLLREKKPDRALPIATEGLSEALARSDHSAECRMRMFLARAHALKSQLLDAKREIQTAIQSAEEHGYRTMLVDLLFHGAGILFQDGDVQGSRLYLARAGHLARSLKLSIRSACFSYLLALGADETKSARPLFRILESKHVGSELEYYLEFYGFLKNSVMTISSPTGRRVIPEAEMRKTILNSTAIYWFSHEATLVVNAPLGRCKETVLRVIPLSADSLSTELFRLLIMNPEGIALEQVHALRSQIDFHPFRHAVPCRMTISRLRALINPAGMNISYHKDTGKYRMESPYPLFTIGTQTHGLIPTRVGLSEREEQILKVITAAGKKTTQELVTEFGVSRQALHPTLKSLVANNHIQLVRKGPTSYYLPVNFVAKHESLLVETRGSIQQQPPAASP